ncbi:MAG: HIT family protein [Halieaceae bacterium]|jgi:diadenosine tetraphosphate (Ap4A) HIT family hydrolase|nr:HIT family protein [Halieaceae bacterium]
MSMPELHPQLQADCHDLGGVASGRLLLSRNASLHWLIVVPDTEATDLLDMPGDALALVMQDCQRIGQWLKQVHAYPKVNFGALGNLVPQLHLHIVGRRPDDPCWPQPVWGNLPAAGAWSDTEISAIREALTHAP